jgi:hypothetical protein
MHPHIDVALLPLHLLLLLLFLQDSAAAAGQHCSSISAQQ